MRSEERRVGKEVEYWVCSVASSRRRHTRLVSDWSSDVCSSDLTSFKHCIVAPSINGQKGTPPVNGVDPDFPDECSFLYPIPNVSLEHLMTDTPVPLGWMRAVYEIGRASCRERGGVLGVQRGFKQKTAYEIGQ